MADRARDFLDYYDRERVQHRLAYYRHRAGRHGRRDARYINAAAGLMFVASAASGLQLAGPEWPVSDTLWSLIALTAPALAIAVAATRILLGHDRNRERFENVCLDLEHLRALGQPSPGHPGDADATAVEAYVDDVEATLARAADGCR